MLYVSAPRDTMSQTGTDVKPTASFSVITANVADMVDVFVLVM